MRIVGIGVDLVSIERFERACARTSGFLDRVLTKDEQGSLRVDSHAARFAAKEAVAKALGVPAGMEWHDCVVRSHPNGEPYLDLGGTVLAASQAQGIDSWHLSLSHDGGMAIAYVLAYSA